MPKTIEKVDKKLEELLDAIEKNSNQLILHNDEHNTFDWVIDCLVKICRHSPEQAEQCSLIVHFKGKCTVKEGDMNTLKPMKDTLVDRGLNVTIE